MRFIFRPASTNDNLGLHLGIGLSIALTAVICVCGIVIWSLKTHRGRAFGSKDNKRRYV